MVILGISLGTTTAGIAIMDEKELVHWQTHSFRAVWSDRKADGIVARLGSYLTRYRVQVVVVKLPPKSHQPYSVSQLLKKVVELCSYHGCMVQTTTKKELKAKIAGAKNHSDIMSFAIFHYPIITHQYQRALSRKNHYHKKLFEAVVAAHLCDKKSG